MSRYIKRYQEYINELFKNNEILNDGYIILYESKIFELDENNYVDILADFVTFLYNINQYKIADSIMEMFTNMDSDDLTVNMFMKELKKKLHYHLIEIKFEEIIKSFPFILIAKIAKTNKIITLLNHKVVETNVDFIKLKKKYTDYKFKIDSDYNFIRKKELEIKKLKNIDFYHGTCLSRMKSILSKGIITNYNDVIFKGFEHKDKIFVTTNINKALTHAIYAAATKNSFAIIIKLKVPDIDMLDLDYDETIDIYGSISKDAERLGYDIIAKKNNKYNNPPIKFDKNILHRHGVYSYKGNIRPSHFINYFIKARTIRSFIDMYDFNDDDYEHFMNILKNKKDLGDFIEINKDDLLKLLKYNI